ncbi:winged helix-turn-helix domain-containing protein [Thiovibrio frasassiensis]|uniref:Winged helix-turn-helix domain-containing protein n=1 Tax=Thiovibrio frasassiensis TaxID=2984131 RepID=A0A9X4MEF0_9BACT|nr:winged helix-turn-helix domain-containing protein [Thiovibrio frasassiensis]MDG4474783.1 winged helix-turn-helix domain-containing protein [Thiovibrio frasassiensis]
MAAPKSSSALTEAGKKVGKALARSGHTVEETGQKMKKAAQKIVKKATKKAEKTVGSAIGTIKKEVQELTHKKGACATAGKTPLFKPGKGMTVEGQIGFLAGDIFLYLSENGPTPVTKITSVMKDRGSLSLLGAALGWLAREAKISFSKDGTKVSIL